MRDRLWRCHFNFCWGFVLGFIIGYMLTWTTYGTWLQGDRRGYVKDGQIMGGDPALLLCNKANLSCPVFRLNKKRKNIVHDQILKTAERMGQDVYAVSVYSNHVHLVVENTEMDVGKVVHKYKADSTYALRKEGVEGRIWTKGYDNRFCSDEKSLQARIEYVKGHGES